MVVGRARTGRPAGFGKDPMRKTLESLIEEYLCHKRRSNSTRTMKTRERRLKAPLTLVLGTVPSELSSVDIVRSIEGWAEGKSPSTVKAGIQEAKALLKWLVRKGYAPKGKWDWSEDDALADLCESYRRKRRTQKPQHRVDDALKLYRFLYPLAEQDPRGVPMVALLGLTMGFRVGEILRLKVGDIDHGGRKLWVECAKTEAGVRDVDVPEPLVALVLEAAQAAGVGHLWPYSNDVVYHRLRRLCAEAGVRPLGTHALRRTNATLRVMGDQNPDVVIRAMGHTNFSMTRGHYVAPGTVENAGQDRLAKVLKLR